MENVHYAEARRRHRLGQAIHDRRKMLGLSQAELARRAGITQAALSRIELGGSTPTIGTLEHLAIALDAELIIDFTPHVA